MDVVLHGFYMSQERCVSRITTMYMLEYIFPRKYGDAFTTPQAYH